MSHRAFGLRENLERPNHSAKIFGEAFQLEDSLAKRFDESWHLEGYVDEHRLEHIRVYRTDVESEDPEQWEVLDYDEDEAPLELLMLQDDM